MDSILLLHYHKTEFGFFKLQSINHSFITAIRIIKSANQNELPYWHHSTSTNCIKAGPPDKKRHWPCVYLIHRLQNNRETAINSLSCLLLSNAILCLGSLTGVRSSGVDMGERSLLSLIPLPRSKSHIFTGEICKKHINRKSDGKTFAQKWLHPQLLSMTEYNLLGNRLNSYHKCKV